MEETSSPKKTVTLQDVMAIIDSTKSGGYDSYHEWSPDYTSDEKIPFLEKMMCNWDLTEIEGRKVIVQFIRELVKSHLSVSIIMTDLLVKYAHLPEIIRVVNEFLSSAYFCHMLLLSMKNYHVKQLEWLMKIKINSEEKKFTERKKDLRQLDLYRKIDELIIEVS